MSYEGVSWGFDPAGKKSDYFDEEPIQHQGETQATVSEINTSFSKRMSKTKKKRNAKNVMLDYGQAQYGIWPKENYGLEQQEELLFQPNEEEKRPEICREEHRDIKKTSGSLLSTRKMNLAQMAKVIKDSIQLLNYEGQVYYYTGAYYQIVSNVPDLIKLIRGYVADNVFGLTQLKTIADLLTLLKTDEELSPSDLLARLAESKNKVALRSGILDFAKKRLIPFSSKFILFYQLDIEWKPNPDIKYYKRFCEMVSGGDEQIKTRINETIGYILSGQNDLKAWFYAGTKTDSGKSTLVNFLSELLGEHLIINRTPRQLGGRFDIGDMPGKLLCTCVDIPRGVFDKDSISLLKSVTGGDRVSVEQKYIPRENIRLRTRFLFGGNFPVSVKFEDSEDAFWNRLVVIPFNRQVAKKDQDPTLIDKLLREKDDVASFALVQYMKMRSKGKNFSVCEEAERMKQRWRIGYGIGDTMTSFLKEGIHVNLTGNKKDVVSCKKLYDYVQQYCLNKGYEVPAYNCFLDWIRGNLPECDVTRKRIDGGKNPLSALTGISLEGSDSNES